jgi:hypothetical protein
VRHSLLVALAACGKAAAPDPMLTRYPLDSPPGVSDLTIDAQGQLWAVPERDRFVIEIGKPGAPVKLHPLDGVPAGLDTESMAWVGATLVLGTEGQDEGTASLLWTELHADGHFVVTRQLPLTDDQLGVTLKTNQGAEAMCAWGADLYVAIETRGTLPDGSRYAPLVHLHDGALVGVDKLQLTTDTGKISALACIGPHDFYAIERHYGVHRIVHVTDHTKVSLDLDPLLHGSRNIEGLVRLPDGHFVLVNDNQSATVDGPTELLVIPPTAVQPRSCVVWSSRCLSHQRTPLPIRRRSSRSTM